jgi:hypothetical protein
MFFMIEIPLIFVSAGQRIKPFAFHAVQQTIGDESCELSHRNQKLRSRLPLPV